MYPETERRNKLERVCGVCVYNLAAGARVAMWAGALVGAVAVLARTAVQAWARVTLVYVVLAVAAREAGQTDA